jgi:hypothetical protein
VDAGKTPTDDSRYYGHFIEKGIAQEGSIVALPADQAAVIARAEAAESDTSGIVLRAIARSLGADGNALDFEAIERDLQAMNDASDRLTELGIDAGELAELLAGRVKPRDLVPLTYTDDGGSPQSAYIPRAAWGELLGESHSALRAALQLTTEAKRGSVEPKQKRQPAPVEVLTPSIADESAELRRIVADLPSMLREEFTRVLDHAKGRVQR